VSALTFLTRVPVGRWVAVGPVDIARGAVLWPVVGAGIGALGGLAAAGLEGPLPALVAGGLGLAVAVLLTGALHVDALADTADALGAGRARALEVMRDSRIGAFGATAVALAMLIEAATLGSLAESGDAVAGFVVAGALSRTTGPAVAQVVPYARADGIGAVFARRSIVSAGAGAALAVGAAVWLFGWQGVAVAAGAGALALACGALSWAWLGGVTGDTLGATIQVTEIGALVALAGLR
jgi:adenosylcobinamide-GDP ribazoletransferase